jgi:hypothetical protein
MRFLSLMAPVAAAALLAGCGSGDDGPALGSAQRPLVATTQAPAVGQAKAKSTGARVNEAAPATTAKAQRKQTTKAAQAAAPSYDALLRQKGAKGSRFSPCNLVSQKRAEAILGGPVQQPLEAPQGPTCIYRETSGKSFVTLAVQAVSFTKIRHQVLQRKQVKVSGRTAYCGRYGQPMLYVPLGRRRVLSVAAPCEVARMFASTAVQRLGL